MIYSLLRIKYIVGYCHVPKNFLSGDIKTLTKEEFNKLNIGKQITEPVSEK